MGADACNQIKPIYTGYPDNKSVAESYYWSLHSAGWQSEREGNIQKAIHYFEEAYKINPDDQWADKERGAGNIEEHPEYLETVVVPLPLKGVYKAGGNSSRENITHAGFNRFCFDFSGAAADGEIHFTCSPDPGENEDYTGFGKPVYSPVHGVVEMVTDNEPDLKPGYEYLLFTGNSITIKDEVGRPYVFIHNGQSSARVKPGERVIPGQIIAEIGNTGMSTVPNLHFGVYSQDWLMSLPVKFTVYYVVKDDVS